MIDKIDLSYEQINKLQDSRFTSSNLCDEIHTSIQDIITLYNYFVFFIYYRLIDYIKVFQDNYMLQVIVEKNIMKYVKVIMEKMK